MPSNQSAASTYQESTNDRAYEDGRQGRSLLRRLGFHIIRHAFGFGTNLSYISAQKLERELETEREDRAREAAQEPGYSPVTPLRIPRDSDAVEVIKRVGSRAYMDEPHTTRNLSSFQDWRARVEKRR